MPARSNTFGSSAYTDGGYPLVTGGSPDASPISRCAIEKRKQGYYEAYQASIQGRLDFLEIEENANSMDILDMMIEEQNAVIRQKSKELELARQKMAREMQERKMHEKLKEKKFDEFKQELNATEKRETDEVAGYQFTSAKEEVEDNGKK